MMRSLPLTHLFHVGKHVSRHDDGRPLSAKKCGNQRPPASSLLRRLQEGDSSSPSPLATDKLGTRGASSGLFSTHCCSRATGPLSPALNISLGGGGGKWEWGVGRLLHSTSSSSRRVHCFFPPKKKIGYRNRYEMSTCKEKLNKSVVGTAD